MSARLWARVEEAWRRVGVAPLTMSGGLDERRPDGFVVSVRLAAVDYVQSAFVTESDATDAIAARIEHVVRSMLATPTAPAYAPTPRR